MTPPAEVVRERVASWRAVLANGEGMKVKFRVGKAWVQARIAPLASGSLDQGVTRLERKLTAAVNAAQLPGSRIEVVITAGDELGLVASCVVMSLS